MHTFEEYKQALDGVGPKLKELILDRASKDKSIDTQELVQLARLAYPDPA